MTIDRLPSSSSLLAALRGDLSRKVGREEGRSRTSGSSQAQRTDGAQARDPKALRCELIEIVKHVRPDDAAAVDEARPRIVRAVLLWEFGQELREHPDWQPMLQRLVSTLAADTGHRDVLQNLIRQLQK